MVRRTVPLELPIVPANDRSLRQGMDDEGSRFVDRTATGNGSWDFYVVLGL